MLTSSFTWHGVEILPQLRARSLERIARAVVFLWNTIQQTLNKSNPPPYLHSSKPGEPPRKRSGFGAANVICELDEKDLAGQVGLLKNAMYMVYLEFGTRRLAPRPWFLATIKKVFPQLQAILEK